MKFLKADKIKKIAQNSTTLYETIYNGIDKCAEKGAKTFEINEIALDDYFDWDYIKNELVNLGYYLTINKRLSPNTDVIFQPRYQLIITWDKATQLKLENLRSESQCKPVGVDVSGESATNSEAIVPKTKSSTASRTKAASSKKAVKKEK